MCEDDTVRPEDGSILMGETTRHKPTALIIDDEVDICYLLKGILRHREVDAAYVTSLTEARNHLQKHDSPSVIFLDNHLSDGMGIEYIQQIKKQHPSSRVIMVTAHDTAADREKAYHNGADFFIGKPFTREIILQIVDKILS
jgi:two-component system OmpR family response regulator